jgi:hypothetical protein
MSDKEEPKEDLSALIEQVANDHGDEGAGAMADHLRNRTTETQEDDEPPVDGEG